MSLFDLLLAAVIFAGAMVGRQQGFWRVIYWAAGVAATLFLSMYFYDSIYGAFRLSFRRGVAAFLVYVILFAGVGIVLWVLLRPFERWVAKNRLADVNRALGFVAGGIVGVILAGFVSLHGLRAAGGEIRASVKGSALAPILLKPAEFVSFLLPARFRDALGTGEVRP